MSYWNHFADCPYDKLNFNGLSVGEIFRSALWKGKRFRGYIICEKTGYLTYVEKKSKASHYLLSPDMDVYNLKTK